ncbi:Hypothetical predicted protein, partial [Pelobates cultripes]
QTEIRILQQMIEAVETRESDQENKLQTTQSQVDNLAQLVQPLTRSITSLETCHRRQNIHLRGIPEKVGGDALLPLSQLLPSIGLEGGTDQTLPISALRVHKAVATPPGAPRDTIA